MTPWSDWTFSPPHPSRRTPPALAALAPGGGAPKIRAEAVTANVCHRLGRLACVCETKSAGMPRRPRPSRRWPSSTRDSVETAAFAPKQRRRHPARDAAAEEEIGAPSTPGNLVAAVASYSSRIGGRSTASAAPPTVVDQTCSTPRSLNTGPVTDSWARAAAESARGAASAGS